jgi:hypothetical protein
MEGMTTMLALLVAAVISGIVGRVLPAAPPLPPAVPVAVCALATRRPIRERIVHDLGKKLLPSDVSGLVCLRFAAAAALTRILSLPQAIGLK